MKKTSIVCVLMLFSLVAVAGGNDDPLLLKLDVEEFEIADTGKHKPFSLEADAWLGYDLDKIWLKADLEKVAGKTEEAEVQLLYSKAVAPFWDWQLGLRQDFGPHRNQSWAVAGFKGLIPYFVEADAGLFVGESGRAALRLQFGYEIMFSQRWVLSPELEFNIHGQNNIELGVGSGLSDVQLGLRLRYDLTRKFSPYIGIQWSEMFGNSADFARRAGEQRSDSQFVVGVKFWL